MFVIVSDSGSFFCFVCVPFVFFVTLMEQPLLVFHQCMDKEWAAWGLDAAREMANAGFAVIRVPTFHWSQHKAQEPDAFANPLRAGVTEREMICKIMMRDVTLPCVDYYLASNFGDLRKLPPSEQIEVVLPPCDAELPCCPVYDVIAITEASALLPPGVRPHHFRSMYNSYAQGLLWAGFNSDNRIIGSKLLLGRQSDFACLHKVMRRTKLYHIDQFYKCCNNDYFTVVQSKKEILMGVRNHISSCGTGPADAMNGFAYISSK